MLLSVTSSEALIVAANDVFRLAELGQEGAITSKIAAFVTYLNYKRSNPAT